MLLLFPQVSANNSTEKADHSEMSGGGLCPCDPLGFFSTCVCGERTTCPYKTAVARVNVGIERTEAGRAVSTFGTEERNLVAKMN